MLQMEGVNEGCLRWEMNIGYICSNAIDRDEGNKL